MNHPFPVRRAAACVLTAGVIGTSVLTAASAEAAARGVESEPTPVSRVDVQRYLGQWYQVAAVPAVYEAQCHKNSKARYSLSATGTVSVKNSCSSYFGLTSSVRGDAKPLDATNARLNVSFLGVNGHFAHGKDANYIVIGLDRDYQWAVVTDSERRSGFVLSRTPQLDAAQTEATRAALQAADVDPCSVKYTPQDGGNRTTARYC